MKILIVHAHPEPKSFCSAMKDTAVETLQSLGHEVQVSDLQRLLKFSALPWSREDCMAMIKLADPDATYV